MMRQIFSPVGVACFLVLQCVSVSAAAPSILEVGVGLDGQSQLGYWTPVRIHVQAGDEKFSGQLELGASDSDGLIATYGGFTDGSFEIAAGEKKWVTGYVKFGRPDSGLQVRLLADGATVVRTEYAPGKLPELIESTADRVLVIGADLELKQALGSRGHSVQVAHLDDFSTFPDRWYGLEGVRQIVVTTSKSQYLEGLTEERFKALQRWLRLGGELVISVGLRGEVLTQDDSPWRHLIPGSFEFIEKEWKTSGLEMYAGSQDPLETGAFSGETAMTVLNQVQGRIEVYDGVGDAGQRPMVVRSLVGFGNSVFVAVDLDLAPFLDWPARSRLLRRITLGEQGAGSADTGSPMASQVSHFGYRDLSGQLRAALGQFKGVTLVRFYWIVGLLVGYVVLIGPLDYLLLRKWNRLHWSWITFPSMVLGFSLLTFLMSASFKTSEVHVNQLDIIDYDVETSQLRGTTWAYVLSPQRRTYDFKIEPRADEQLGIDQLTGLCSWQGLPGNGLGGLDTRSTSTSIEQQYGVRLAPGQVDPGMGRIQGLPIQDSSCRGLNASWWGQGSLDVVSRLYFDRQGVLQGEVSNPFPFALQECRLYHQNQVYVIDHDVEPGQMLRVSNLLDSVRAVEAYLLRRKLVQRAEAMQAWSASDFDVPRIVEMLMFHEKAGGARYTKMTHRYQEFLDLSERLDWNRAILVGRAAGQGSGLVANQSPPAASTLDTWTYFRLVFPISTAAP